MFLLILFGGVFMAIGVALIVIQAMNWFNGMEAAGVGIFVVIVCVVIMAISIPCTYSFQTNDFARIKGLEKKIELYEKRSQELRAVIRSELDKYPALEKKILNKVNPQILLNYPTLKSNETIMMTCKEIIALEKDTYEIRAELIEQQQEIYERELSPWVVYVTPYEQFFGKKNPVAAK